MARGFLRWSTRELAEASGVAESTIKRMEADDGLPGARGSSTQAVYQAIREALKERGAMLVPENGGGAGIRLQKSS